MSGYRVETCTIAKPEDVKREWLAVQDRADCSYFQSWGWIGTWLEQIAIGRQPLVLKVWFDGNLVGLGLFVGRDIKRHVFIRAKALFLNEYPFDGKNMVIEYNGVLAARGYEQAVNAEMLGYLLSEYPDHDEFYFGAIADGPSSASLIEKPLAGADVTVTETSVCWSVHLDAAARDRTSYLAGLSRNRRGQVRRALRLYEQQQPLRVEEAGNMDQALRYFDRLKVLHTQRWQAVGKRGSFANPVWEHFHRTLIRDRFDKGEIQLLKIHSGHDEIGYLYNFIWRQQVYVLQTGFGPSGDKRLMPGYVAHVMAIVHNSRKGMRRYDLMHGDELYKRMLCSQQQKMFWIVVQRRRAKFVVERAAVRIIRRIRNGLRS